MIPSLAGKIPPPVCSGKGAGKCRKGRTQFGRGGSRGGGKITGWGREVVGRSLDAESESWAHPPWAPASSAGKRGLRSPSCPNLQSRVMHKGSKAFCALGLLSRGPWATKWENLASEEL